MLHIADGKVISPLCNEKGELGYEGTEFSFAWKLVCGCSGMASADPCRAGLTVENCLGISRSCTCTAQHQQSSRSQQKYCTDHVMILTVPSRENVEGCT